MGCGQWSGKSGLLAASVGSAGAARPVLLTLGWRKREQLSSDFYKSEMAGDTSSLAPLQGGLVVQVCGWPSSPSTGRWEASIFHHNTSISAAFSLLFSSRCLYSSLSQWGCRNEHRESLTTGINPAQERQNQPVASGGSQWGALLPPTGCQHWGWFAAQGGKGQAGRGTGISVQWECVAPQENFAGPDELTQTNFF